MKNNIHSSELMEASKREQLINKVRKEFKLKFKNEPKKITLTPARINIIGEHTDYNEGLAMPVAIDRWICTVLSKSSNKFSTIYSLNYNESILITPHMPDKLQEIWKQLAASSIHVIIIIEPGFKAFLRFFFTISRLFTR